MDHLFKSMWGSFGTADGQFNKPHDIAIDSDGNVYVVDYGNHRVQKFSSTGVFLDKWGEPGNGEGQFSFPTHIGIDSSNNVYVTEQLGLSPVPPRVRIQKFTNNGDFIKQWGQLGFGAGEFRSPKGIAVGSNDNVLVVDSDNHRIQKFTKDGEFITKWGRYEFGDGLHLGSANDIAVDPRGASYVTDGLHHSVKKFGISRNFIRQWGSRGSADGEFDRPGGIATFSGSSLLVVDHFNHRVQEFSRTGIFITGWGSNGTQAGQFITPTGVAINKINDMHYIADTGNHRIQRFHWDPAVP
jgi:tripartite motif-containing protein 71